ncbi:MAG: hydroxyphenylacetyl-CoA thioesterase PaaI [Telmatospirillum sp.]|nr:hydroxyphenylacetyl-CoA thioesterase PaaI [Telmatospirillum sp.]
MTDGQAEPIREGREPGEQALARSVGDHLMARDLAARSLGITLAEIRPGYARCVMTVRADMLNGHRTLHGGMSFALADTAFACACNARNRTTVAAGCDIVFPAAGRLGDTLIAEAVERHLAGRSGVYDVTITNQDGTVLALFRGRSRQIKGIIIPHEETASDD